MRISDWSSDVCSSDLRPRQLHIAAGRLNRPHRPHRVRRYGADMAGKKPGGRPLSPHLGVYKWAPSMAVSIFHRVSGDGLAIVGGLMFLWWLGALAAGPDAYAAFVACVWHDPDAGTLHQVTNKIGIAHL